MKKLLILIFVCLAFQIVASSVSLNRLSSDETAKNILNVGDEIVSTLGYFKAVLESSFCQLKIYQFNQETEQYEAVDLYKNSQISSCNSIKMQTYQILTDQSKVFAELPNVNYTKTYLTIDDMGVIRFIGIVAPTTTSLSLNSQEIILFSLSQSKIKYQNIKSFDEIQMNQLNLAYVNDKQWAFKFANNLLTISSQNNASLTETFNLENINLNKSGYYQVNGKSYPFIFSTNAFEQPRCDLRKTGCEVRSPYTIEMNRYWPIVRVFDQEKYLIAEYSLSNSNLIIPASICPPGSFLSKDSCVKQCSNAYYEYITGSFGECVLVCPEGSIFDSQSKRCSCSEKDLLNNQQDKKKIKKCERGWNATFFGCDCESSTLVYDSVNTLSCQTTCSVGTLQDNGTCYECPENCNSCSRDKSYLHFSQCDNCSSGFNIENGQCVKEKNNCSANCDECNIKACLRCSNFYSLYNGKCLTNCPSGFTETSDVKNGSYCIDNSVMQSNQCSSGCTKCQDSICLSCASGYIMFVSPLTTTCKIKNFNTKCPEQYTFDSTREICYYSNYANTSMGNCTSNVNHCQICKSGSQETCIVCQEGYFLYKNQCVQKCPSGSLKFNNICVDQISNCLSEASLVFESEGNISFDLMKSSTSYKRQIYNGLEPTNDPVGYEIYLKEFILNESTNNASYSTIARTSQIICSKCRKGYGLSDDQTQCLACPSSCSSGYCYFARENSCYNQTIQCTYLDENGNCMESCPEGRYPQVDSNGVLKCLPASVSSVNDYLKVDSSYYLQGDGSKIYYFVLNQPVENGSTPLTARLLFASHSSNLIESESGQENHRRVLVETENVLFLQNGQYYSVKNTDENAVAISFESKINEFRTPFGFTLANTVYGAEADYTHSEWMKEWLAHVGYVMSWIILLVHCIYIGNTILYKVDNLIILAQTIYFFTFVKLLVGNTLAQYYYGWFWMHMGFFPNYFKYTVPVQYDETEAPLPYKLATLDGNFIRNAGYAVSLLITFLATWVILSLCTYLINKIFKKSEIWYQGIAKNSLIAVIELLSMVLFFFSVSQLLYDDVYPEASSDFHHSNVGASIFFICIISVYTLVRAYFNSIGGLYMFKRIVIALILVGAYSREAFLALIIALEVCIGLVRYLLERPRLLREKIFMLAECTCFVLAYILLFLVTVPGVNVLIITVIIFVLLLFLIADLIDVYMEARNELYEFDFLGAKYDNQSHQEDEVPESERKMNV